MIKGYSAAQVRAAEAPLLAAGEPLMTRAAAGLAREIRGLLPGGGGNRSDDGRILLLVGSGNNGGDTLYAGAELADGGVDVAIIVTGAHVHEQALAAALAAGAHREETDVETAARLAANVDVIVDGIVGTGSGRGTGGGRNESAALRGTAREIVEAIMPALVGPRPPPVVAVDIPSGVDPDDGSVPDPLVLPAEATVTFGGYKAGLLIAPASSLCGRVVLIDIGLGPDLDRIEPVIRVDE